MSVLLPIICGNSADLPAHPLVPPTGSWEFALVALGMLIMAASFVYGLWATFDVSEEAGQDHVKRRVLLDPAYEVPHER